MRGFTDILVVSPHEDGRFWRLREEFSYQGRGNTVKVPLGFVTDFASIPRLLWWMFPRWGSYGQAAVIHDFCYWDQSLVRSEADYIFWEAMSVLKVFWCTRALLYSGVRSFGWFAWWLNGRRKKSRYAGTSSTPVA